MENNLIKSNLKQFDFQTHTPLRTPHGVKNTGDLISSQKLKYDTAHRQLSTTLNMYNNPPVLSESFANQKEVYDNQVKVRVKSHDREEYQLLLNLKIAMLNQTQSHVQILHIELTDESNHLFLYTLDLSETDFFALKNEQSLLVDFQAFPSKFVEMLELCLNSSGGVNFLCELIIKNTGEAFFNIVEANQFRALTHLSLKFREGNDQTVKKYLAGRLANERATTAQLRLKVEGLEDALGMRGTELEVMQSEYKKLQADKENKIDEIRNAEARRMNEMQRMALEKETELKNEFDRDRRELVAQYEKRTRELEEKIGSLTVANTDLLNTKIELESKQRELTGNLKAFEKENAVLQSEILSRRTENTELSEVRFSNEKKVAELGAKIDNLETQMKNKEELVKKSNELLETTNKQKAILEENIVDYKKQIDKLELKVTQSCEEVTKGNAMIEKLQNEMTVQKQKTKDLIAMANNQDAEINGHISKIQQMTQEMNELRREKDDKQTKIRDLEITAENLKNQLAESQKAIESSNSMIQWLHKSLNEQGRPPAPRATMTTSKYGAVSPMRQYGEDLGMASSQKYTSTLNADRLAKYQNDDYNPSYTGGASASFGGRNNTTSGYGYNNQKSVTKNTSDFENDYLGGGGNLNKENFDVTNKSGYKNPGGSTGMTAARNPYSTTPVKDDFTGTFTGTRPIQPILYEAKK